ncbi:MAG: hypothetical protein Q9211_000614 [Gyalolechia sp. 1 TL-2023]
MLVPRVGSQEYVWKLLKQNLESNRTEDILPRKPHSAFNKASTLPNPSKHRNLDFLALDWEINSVDALPDFLGKNKAGAESKIDMVIACDCIYNESLIDPFVRTCADLCRLADTGPSENPTICVIAQQLRSPDVFEAWLTVFMDSFRVWRVPGRLLSEGLSENSGYAVHVGILHSSFVGREFEA